MGLFDQLKKVAVEKIVDTVEKSFGTTAEPHAGPLGGTESSVAPAAAPQSTEWAAPQTNTVNLAQQFDQIFATEFPDLQVLREATPESVGLPAVAPCRPYSYALLRNGQTAALVMVTPHNRDRNSAFRNARAAAQNSNVVFLNFYTHLPNERNYVVSRIRSAL